MVTSRPVEPHPLYGIPTVLTESHFGSRYPPLPCNTPPRICFQQACRTGVPPESWGICARPYWEGSGLVYSFDDAEWRYGTKPHSDRSLLLPALGAVRQPGDDR